jgi:hypothetical protein
MQGGAVELDLDSAFNVNELPATNPVATSQFLQKRSQEMIRTKHETSLVLKDNKTSQKGGYDISRL